MSDKEFYLTLRMSEPATPDYSSDDERAEESEDDFRERCVTVIRTLSVDEIMMFVNYLLAELKRRAEGGGREGGIYNPE